MCVHASIHVLYFYMNLDISFIAVNIFTKFAQKEKFLAMCGQILASFEKKIIHSDCTINFEENLNYCNWFHQMHTICTWI